MKPSNLTGLYENSKGGTEMMYQRIMNRLTNENKKEYQIICSRVRDIDGKKRPIFWAHDFWDDVENEKLKDEEFRDKFSAFVFVSNHQFQTYHMAYQIPYSRSIVLNNGIIPIETHKKPEDKINIIYHTTPHRGLEIAVPVFKELCKSFENLHFDIYSSFKIYGWDEKDVAYNGLYDECEKDPKITYHGFKKNSIVREALKKAHIFGYPSIWPETSCLSVIEAMSAKTLVVSSDLGALTETTGNLGFHYRFNEDVNKHAKVFYQNMYRAITGLQDNRNKFDNLLNNVRNYSNMKYDIDTIGGQWNSYLNHLRAIENEKSKS